MPRPRSLALPGLAALLTLAPTPAADPAAIAPSPARRDLAAALDEVLAGKPVTVPQTEADGCSLERTTAPATKPTVTYSRDVARIVRAHCQECHRPGQAGPMVLTTADDLAAWAG